MADYSVDPPRTRHEIALDKRHELDLLRIKSAEHPTRKTFLAHVTVNSSVERILLVNDHGDLIAELSASIQDQDIVFEIPEDGYRKLTEKYLESARLRYSVGSEGTAQFYSGAIESAIANNTSGRFLIFDQPAWVRKDVDFGEFVVYVSGSIDWIVKRWFHKNVITKLQAEVNWF